MCIQVIFFDIKELIVISVFELTRVDRNLCFPVADRYCLNLSETENHLPSLQHFFKKIQIARKIRLVPVILCMT